MTDKFKMHGPTQRIKDFPNLGGNVRSSFLKLFKACRISSSTDSSNDGFILSLSEAWLSSPQSRRNHCHRDCSPHSRDNDANVPVASNSEAKFEADQ